MATWEEIVNLRDNGYNTWESAVTYMGGAIVKKNSKYFVALNAADNLNKDPEDVANNSFWKEINQTQFGV